MKRRRPRRRWVDLDVPAITKRNARGEPTFVFPKDGKTYAIIDDPVTGELRFREEPEEPDDQARVPGEPRQG